MSDRRQKRVCGTVGDSLASFLGIRWLIVEMKLAYFYIGINLVDIHLNWLNLFHFLILVAVSLVILIGCNDFSVSISRCVKNVYVNRSFPRTARLWNYLSAEYFHLAYDLNGFNSRVNTHPLFFSFF